MNNVARETLVMRGSLQEFQLPDVLQVVGLSRQYTVIELRSADGSRRGLISMKAGQVLTAEHGQSKGRSAFFQLFEQAPELFHVFRMPDSKSYPSPLGPLVRLLFEAADRASEPDTTVDRTPAPPKPKQAASAMAAGSQVAPQPTAPPRRRAPSVVPSKRPARPVGPSVPRVVARRSERPTSPPPVASGGGGQKIVVAVASPKGGVGKTTITLNLALSLAERGLDTLIVDADINGDILSSLDARGRADRGAFDLLDDPDVAVTALRQTAQPHLRILPACGPSVPAASLERPDLAQAWARLLTRLRHTADVTLVDCPAGMFHTTSAVLRASSHVVGVFQAEILSSRSFSMFLRGLATLPPDQRPALAGVVVNMFHGRADGSIEAFHSICTDGDRHRLFDTTIPRSEAFGRASEIGQPLRAAGEDASPIAFLFDMLAEEVCRRVGVGPDQAATSAGGFLV